MISVNKGHGAFVKTLLRNGGLTYTLAPYKYDIVSLYEERRVLTRDLKSSKPKTSPYKEKRKLVT